MVIHVCPACGARHEVHPLRDQLAYGAQLACSGRCKSAYRRRVLARGLAAQRATDAVKRPRWRTEYEID